MNKLKIKSNFKKTYSLILVITLMLSIIYIPEKNANAEGIKPQIDVTYLGTNPQEPMVGQDIEVRYEVTPQPFQYKISKPKEIVLVLDGSGSMEGSKLTSLKNAANAFIERLKYVDNLKVGIVVYSSEATINPINIRGDKDLTPIGGGSSVHKVPGYESLTKDYLLPISDVRLKTMIGNIKALGGTNTGEGIRKAEFLLQQGDSNANKTIILMSDGLPTFYSVNSKNASDYYVKIDNEKTSIYGSGSEQDENIKQSTKYATTIGNIIKKKNYSIFSIGYGLGESNSTGNKKMQEIHMSMGGVVNINNPSDINNTFFATEDGAIESIFNKIADKLLESYSINDVKLSGNLGNSFTEVEGFEVGVNNQNVIKVPPIFYELTKVNGEDWYTAKPIIITFKIKANKSGVYPIFDSNSNIEYTSVDGKKISIPFGNDSIAIKEFTIEDSKKLQVNFYSERNGYLIGDLANIIVGFTKPIESKIDFNNAKFDITNGIPAVIDLSGSSPVLNFGTITDTTATQQYKVSIKETENENEVINHTISGKYSYSVKQGSSTANIWGTENTSINIKRGQVITEILDTNGNSINEDIKVYIEDTSSDTTFIPKESSEINNGIINFNNVPSGNYKVTLTNIPNGYEFTNGNETIVSVNYENNITKYTFVLNGESRDMPNIKATLKNEENMVAILGDEVSITYEIEAEPFKYDKYSSESQDIVLVVDTTSAENGKEFTKTKESIKEKIVDEFMKSNNNVKMSVVSFDDKGVVNESNELTNSIDLISEYIEALTIKGDKKDDTKGNITNAIIAADRILESGASANKSMVFITFGDIDYDKSKLNEIKEKQYNIFSTYIRRDNNDKEDNIKELYYYLDGIVDNYINNKGNNGNELKNGIMERLKERLNGDLINQYIVKDVLINFDLGENLDPINGFINNESRNVKVKVPEIKYILNTTTMVYESQEIKDITIVVKPNIAGNISFGNENTISYKNLTGENINKPIIVPKINVIDNIYNINHGLYESIEYSGISIREESVSIAGGTTINFGATFITKSISPIINLEIDSRYEDIKNIEIYKLNNSNPDEIKLDKLNGNIVANNGDNKSWNISLPAGVSEGTNILIRYSAKLPNSRKITYSNSIKVGSSQKEIRINTTDVDNVDRLPDLF